MKSLFVGKTVLVTGAASGIGRAIARAAAAEGARLVLGDVAADPLNALVSELADGGTAVFSASCDVCRQSDLDALVARGVAALGPLDVVYANAGILGTPGDVWTYAEAEFQSVLEINVLGTWRTFKAVLPGMLERKSGTIVATSSAAGLIGPAGLPAYVASKHAVLGLVKTTAMNVAAQGIRVNALCPGMVDTPMLDKVAREIPGLRQSLMQQNPMGRVATPEEVAQAAIWLGSDLASFVTGHPLVIDGGLVAQ
ncbi:MAG TPA: glucose 1-dehydrogenase [Nevskiaceae bacterium]|nr:glucose 1-dehydrogenase [Nevskiaceae bacterium]